MSDALLWNEIGNIYIKMGSTDEAIAAFIKAIKLKPDFGWSYLNLGHAYFLKGEFGHSLYVFHKSVQYLTSPENLAIAWNKIGDAYRGMKDIENAIQAYKKADQINLEASGIIPETLRQPCDAVDPREMSGAGDASSEENGLIGESLLLKSRYKSTTQIQFPEKSLQPTEADKDYSVKKTDHKQLGIKYPFTPKLNLKSGQEISAKFEDDLQNLPCPVGNSENASFKREKSIIVIPDQNPERENLDGEVISQDEPEEIKDSKECTKQIESQEISPNKYLKPYPILENLEEILAKVNIYENITRVNPTNDRAWDTLGKLYKSLGRYQDAINAYQKAIEMAPEREVYHYYLGLLYSVVQQHDDAVRAFQFVLSKNPEYVLAHSALAGVYHRMGLENKANHHIAAALPKMSNESMYNRACFYAICGDVELALEFLRLALANKDTTIEWIKSDPDLDPIRTDQRYLDLISEKEQHAPDISKENYFSSEMDGKQNQLLPILNQSLTR